MIAAMPQISSGDSDSSAISAVASLVPMMRRSTKRDVFTISSMSAASALNILDSS
jgi:hypothetical protein